MVLCKASFTGELLLATVVANCFTQLAITVEAAGDTLHSNRDYQKYLRNRMFREVKVHYVSQRNMRRWRRPLFFIEEFVVCVVVVCSHFPLFLLFVLLRESSNEWEEVNNRDDEGCCMCCTRLRELLRELFRDVQFAADI